MDLRTNKLVDGVYQVSVRELDVMTINVPHLAEAIREYRCNLFAIMIDEK
jgi:hypothetical protein